MQVHGRIQIYHVCQDDSLSNLSSKDLPLGEKHSVCQFFAVSRKAHIVAFYEEHEDEGTLRERLKMIAIIDWQTASGREFEEFTTFGAYSPRKADAHTHYFPPWEVRT
jgi:hypothetical protein